MFLIIFQFIIYFFIIYITWDSIYKYLYLPPVQAKKNHFRTYNGLLYYVFDLLPRRIAEFAQAKSDKSFDEFGLILYCGPQGQGKTYSMVHEVTKIYATYPDCKIYGNLWTMLNDKTIDTWHELVFAENGNNGLVFMFDEISLWWNSRFRDLNPLVLQELVQNRKNKRVIFGTCQNISMCDRQIRLQSTEYRNCHCLLGAFIFCTCWQPVFDMSTGELIDKHFLGFKFYAQDDCIRYSYDTYQTIKRLAESGFNYDIATDAKNIDIIRGDNNEKIKRRRKKVS